MLQGLPDLVPLGESRHLLHTPDISLVPPINFQLVLIRALKL